MLHRTHKNGYSLRGTSYHKSKQGNRHSVNSKSELRLLGDGFIYNNKLNKTVGYIKSKVDRDIGFELKQGNLQEYLKSFI